MCKYIYIYIFTHICIYAFTPDRISSGHARLSPHPRNVHERTYNTRAGRGLGTRSEVLYKFYSILKPPSAQDTNSLKLRCILHFYYYVLVHQSVAFQTPVLHNTGVLQVETGTSVMARRELRRSNASRTLKDPPHLAKTEASWSAGDNDERARERGMQ